MQYDSPITVNDVSYLQNHKTISDELAADIDHNYKWDKSEYDAIEDFLAEISDMEITGTMVRAVARYVRATVKTQSGKIKATADMIHAGDFRKDKQFLLKTTDGAKKHELDHKWSSGNSSEPEKVAELLNDDKPFVAMARLMGRKENGEKLPQEKTYARTTKSMLVVNLLGFPVGMCMDSRRRKALSGFIKPDNAEEGALTGTLTRPATHMDNPFRIHDVNGYNESNAGSQHHFEEILNMNPHEYACITEWMAYSISIKTDVPKEVVPFVLFNMAGPSTFHKTIRDELLS